MANNSACLFGKRENNSRRVFIEITDLCNMYCKHCMNNSGKNTWPGLPKEKMKNLFTEISEQNVVYLYISGGEPLLYDGIDEVLEHAYNLGMKVTLATNGMGIKEHLSAIEKYIDVISISLDGIGNIHDEFRGVEGAFIQLQESLQILQEKKINVKISSIIWKKNMEQLEDMVFFAKKYGVRKVNFNILVPVGRAKNNVDIIIHQKKYQELYQKIDYLRKKYTTDCFEVQIKRNEKLKEESEQCPGGTTIYHINSHGKVSPCSWISKIDDTEYSLYWESGNLKQCFEKCHNLSKIIDRRVKKYGYSGCPALANIYNGEYYSEDPLNSII